MREQTPGGRADDDDDYDDDGEFKLTVFDSHAG